MVTDGRAEQLARLARGWDEAAEGYERYYVPRFAPWVAAAVRALPKDLPDGPVLVPCCGTFPELDALVTQLPDRDLVGIDLSAGMVRLARERAEPFARVRVVEGDASTLDPRSAAAVVSVFGLQQLPAPAEAIASWAAALLPGGRLSVVYWPARTEDDGPFARVAAVVGAHVGRGDGAWERELAPAVTAQGVAVESDEAVSHPMSHPDAATFFEAYTRSGPLRPLATARGDAFVTRLRAEFLRDSPPGEWHHRPTARHIVARRATG
ncbi:class I SAM-dependent methyltransferase [Asanoa sp. NPDC050611]|uniref:class I SAM-dependent methyltransferase n=1 Tax=Asanoa sp. NPDC050611 TaxID=3157098 RepID=UPI0033E9A72F